MSRLSETLEAAYQVCNPCGDKYGKNKPAKNPEYYKAVCDICDADTDVTEFHHFGFQRQLLPREKFTKEHLA